MGGPLLLIVLGIAALLAWRYLPVQEWLMTPVSDRVMPDEQVMILAQAPEGAQPPAAATKRPKTPPDTGTITLPDPGSVAAIKAPDEVPDSAGIPAVGPGTDGIGGVGVTTPARVKPPVETASPPRNTGPTPTVDAAVSATPKPKAVAKPAVPEKTAVQTSENQVALQRKATITPAPAARKPSVANLRVFVQAQVDERAGLGGYTADGFATLLRGDLERIAVRQFGADAVKTGGANPTFHEQFADDPDQARDALCQQAASRRVLLADVTIPSAGFSTVKSAYWPEVVFRAISCSDGRMRHRPRARLEPHVRDGFPFQYQFGERAENFVASQGYFLNP